MNNTQCAILLINVGSPDTPTKKSVRRFLVQFLNDKRVIDLPWLFRKLLVNLIIIPFRVKKSTALYKRLFDAKGSPLIYHTKDLEEKLQKKLGNRFRVFTGMRYGNPGYKQAIRDIQKEGIPQIIVVPLFPQHAMSTTETAIEAVQKKIKKQEFTGPVEVVEQFYDHPKFIQAFVEQVKKYNLAEYDHILFSYHGLPLRHIEKSHPGKKAKSCGCQNKIPEDGKYCYKATCHATSRLIAAQLGIDNKKYSDAFQSRLSRNWLSPFSDEVLLEQLRKGHKNILVVAPSFVCDCLETTTEIGEDYQQLFLENGGKKLQLVESLNANDPWVEALAEIITQRQKP